MPAGLGGDFSAAFGSPQETYLQQIRLDDIFQRVPLFAQSCGDCFDSRRAAVIDFDKCTQNGPVQLIQTQWINPFHFQRAFDNRGTQNSCAFDLRIVPNTAKKIVGDTRSPPAATGDFVRPVLIDLDSQNPGGANDNLLQILCV